MHVATNSAVLEAVAEALSKTLDFKTRIKNITLVVSHHQVNQQGIIFYNHLKENKDTLLKITDLVAANDEVRRFLFENTTPSTARDGYYGLITERPTEQARAPAIIYTIFFKYCRTYTSCHLSTPRNRESSTLPCEEV